MTSKRQQRRASGKQKAQEAGRCLFCDHVGNMTHEHIWSDWIAEHLPEGTSSRTEEAATGLFDHEGNRLPDQPQRVKQGGIHKKTVRCICRACNSGWMSTIVQKAKPHLLKLIRGEEIVLSETEQDQVATWLALQAMMANLLTAIRHRVHPHDVQFMYEHKRAPPTWHIGIGSYLGEQVQGYCQSLVGVGLTNSRTGRYQEAFAMIVTSNLLLRLFSIVHIPVQPQHHLATISPMETYRPYLAQIWPVIHPVVRFPPPAVFGILGSFVFGGLASELAVRLQTQTAEAMKKMGGRKRD